MEVQGIVILFRLMTSHFLADFLLQPDSWIKDRQRRKLRSRYFWLHISIVGISTYVLLGEWKNWQVPLIITATHLLIDVIKILSKKDNMIGFLMDQSSHLLVIIIVWLWITDQWQWVSQVGSFLLQDEQVWIITLGYIINTVPLAVFIRILTNGWSEEIRKSEDDQKITALKDAGKWIGIIERILIFTFILWKEFQAIGFLLAAKSVFRFGDLKNTKDRNKTEYILIGTLISFASSIVSGLLILHLLQ